MADASFVPGVYKTDGGDKLVVASGGTLIVESGGLLSVEALAAGYIVVSKDGSDTLGEGTPVAPYLTLAKALASVTTARKTVLVLPGAYEEEDSLTWPTISGVKLVGLASMWQTTLSAASGDQLISVAPGAVSGTWEMWLENLYLDHGTSGQDGILLDNTSMTKKLNCYLRNVGGDAHSASDKMLTTTHGDTDNAIRVYWSGDGGAGVEGVVSFTGGNDGDRLHISDAELNGGLSTSDTAVACDIRLRNCIVLHEGITGGNAAQTVTLVNCFTDASGTFAVCDASDVAGSQTPAIVPDFS